MLSALIWFPSLQEDEERRLTLALERQRVAQERAPLPPLTLRERISLAAAAARGRRRRAALAEAACCPA